MAKMKKGVCGISRGGRKKMWWWNGEDTRTNKQTCQPISTLALLNAERQAGKL